MNPNKEIISEVLHQVLQPVLIKDLVNIILEYFANQPTKCTMSYRGSCSATAIIRYDDDHVIVGFADGTIRMWNSAVQYNILQYNMFDSPVKLITKLQDNIYLSCSKSGITKTWSIRFDDIRVLDIKEIKSYSINSAIKIDNNHLAIVEKKSLDIFNISKEETKNIEMVGIKMLVNINNTYFASLNIFGQIHLWDISGKHTNIIYDYANMICEYDNDHFLICSNDGLIFTCDINGEHTKLCTINVPTIQCMKVLHDGYIAIGTSDTVEIFNQQGICKSILLGGADHIVELREGKLATITDNTTYIWN